MKSKMPILIMEDTLKFKKGQIVENYKKVDEGIEVESDYLNESKFIMLTEKFSADDEKRIRELIREQLKKLFWNLYAKQGIML